MPKKKRLNANQRMGRSAGGAAVGVGLAAAANHSLKSGGSTKKTLGLAGASVAASSYSMYNSHKVNTGQYAKPKPMTHAPQKHGGRVGRKSRRG